MLSLTGMGHGMAWHGMAWSYGYRIFTELFEQHLQGMGGASLQVLVHRDSNEAPSWGQPW